MAGGRKRGATAKQLKRMLKKAGLKTTGRKAALTRRVKKAHLKLRGGVKAMVCLTNGEKNNKSEEQCKGPQDQWTEDPDAMDVDMGGRRRRNGSKSRSSRKSKGFQLY